LHTAAAARTVSLLSVAVMPNLSLFAMSATKILWGQIIVVVAIVLVATWAAT
jgi:hypothetical protein